MGLHKRPLTYRVMFISPEDDWQEILINWLDGAVNYSQRQRVKELASELLEELSKVDECHAIVTLTRKFFGEAEDLKQHLYEKFNEDEVSFPDANTVSVTVDVRGRAASAEFHVTRLLDAAMRNVKRVNS